MNVPGQRSSQLLTAIVVAVTLLLLWVAGDVFLMAFGGLVMAVFLNALAMFVHGHLRLSYRAAVVLVVLLLAALCIVTFYFIGMRMMQQVNELLTTVPHSMTQIREYIEKQEWGRWLLDRSGPSAESLVKVTQFAARGFTLLIDLVVILVLGIYIAAESDLYRAGTMRLVPTDRRPRADQVMKAVAFNLRWWLLGQAFAMAVIGVVIGIAMWLLRMPLALSLGLLAGLFEIVPTIGPILWLIPAVLLAMAVSARFVVYVFLVYCGLHLFESYVLIPIVQRRAVTLPPALGLFSVVLLTLLMGPLGTIMAAPLTVVALVLVKMLYVEDRLGDRAIEVMREPQEAPRAPV